LCQPHVHPLLPVTRLYPNISLLLLLLLWLQASCSHAPATPSSSGYPPS
jgi:hypothetical protein